MASPTRCFVLALLIAAPASTAMAANPVAELPPGFWNAAQRQEALKQTRTVRLAPNLDDLRPGERAALAELIAAGTIVQSLYERQTHAQAEEARKAIDALSPGPARDEIEALYRLSKGPIAATPSNERIPFVPVGPEQPGKGLYPPGLQRDELNAWIEKHPERRAELLDPFSVVRRATRAQLDADLAELQRHETLDVLHPGLRARLTELRKSPEGFYSLPYSVAWPKETLALYGHLQRAATAVEADDAQFAGYLRARARDLLSDDYQAGDAAWVTGRFRRLNALIGAYETYGDTLLGVRRFWSMSILARREAESRAVEAALGGLQSVHDNLPHTFPRRLPERVPVGVYDVVADFGDARADNNASILPSDPDHTERYGRLILLRANILDDPDLELLYTPTWRAAIVAEQQADYIPAARAQRTLWHEIGHYVGVDRTTDGRDLKTALQDTNDALEELKSDLVAMHAVPALQEEGYYSAEQAHAVYAAGIQRMIKRARPKMSQAHQTGHLIQWNWFLDRGVLTFDPSTQRLRIDYDKQPSAVRDLLAQVLEVQAAGDRDRAKAFIDSWTTWRDDLHEPIAKAIRESQPYATPLLRYGALGE
jgi:hypothetical protein